MGLDGPYYPFPQYGNYPDGKDYLDYLFDFLQPAVKMKLKFNASQVPQDPVRGARERIIEKSRTMLGTWACVGFFTHQAMTLEGQEFIFQSQTQEKAEELIGYSKILWNNQEPWLKAEFPLDRKFSDLPRDLIRWRNGSRIIGIPNDPEKIRMYHPTGLLMDEAAYMQQFRANRETAIHACKFIVALSSAGPSEFADFVQC